MSSDINNSANGSGVGNAALIMPPILASSASPNLLLASSPKPVVTPQTGGATAGLSGAAEAAAGMSNAAKMATAEAAAAGTALATKYPDLVNKMQHVFGKAQHGLGAFLNSFGGNQTAAFGAIDKAAQQAVQAGNITGVVPRLQVVVQGVPMEVRGRVIDGVFKIGTAYIP